MKLVSCQIHIANPGKPHQPFEVSEGTFHLRPNAAFPPIPFFLPRGQMGTASTTLIQDTVIYPIFPALPFQGVIGIPFVTEQGALVTRHQMLTFSGIVNEGCGKPDSSDNARPLVNSDMTFVPEVSFLSPLGRLGRPGRCRDAGVSRSLSLSLGSGREE